MLGIYCRISKEGDSKRSTETQMSMGVKFADKNNLKYKVYVDSGLSGGKNRDKRPELDRLLNDIEDGLITSLYVYNQDRAARDEVTWFQMVAIVKDNNVSFFENGILVDLEDSGTFTMRGIKAIFDADERRKTSKRFKDVLRRNAEKGRRFSLIQFGYKEGEDKRLVIDEEKAEIVRRIFQMSLDGKGVSKIAEILNKEGIKTTYNGMEGTYKVINKYTGEVQVKQKSEVTWKGGTINKILNNPIYKGERKWGNEVYPAPAIMEEWYWQKVNDNFKNNTNTKGKAVEHKYLLKGLLRCAKCGSNYYGRTRVAKDNKKPKDNYYMCSSKRRGEHNCGNKSISIDALDTLIWVHIIWGGRMREILELYFDDGSLNKRRREIIKQLENAQKKLEALNSRKDKIIEAIGLDIISLDDARNQMGLIKTESHKWESEIANIKNILEAQIANQSSKKDRLNLFKHLKGLSIEGKRDLIRRFIKNIEILNKPYEGCYITIQFVDFGINDEEYFITPNNKEAHNFPSNPTKKEKLGERVYFNLVDWSKLLVNDTNQVID